MIERMRSSQYCLTQYCALKLGEVPRIERRAYKLSGHFDACQPVIELSVSHYAPDL